MTPPPSTSSDALLVERQAAAPVGGLTDGDGGELAIQLLAELKALGTAQNRRVYARHGVDQPLLGVSYGNLRPIARRLPRDQGLARALWSTGVHEARLLACLVSDPSSLTTDDAEAWIDDCANYVLTDEVCAAVSRTPWADRMALTWSVHPGEWRSSAGWGLICHLAADTDAVDDDWLSPFIDHIVHTLPAARNRTRHAMNAALIAIGGYRPRLRPSAIGAAQVLGKVEVDHGRTGCVTPDAAAYIAKMASREVDRPRKRRAKKKTAKKKTTRVDAKRASRPTRSKKKTTRVDAKRASRPTRSKKKTAKKKTAKKKTAKKKTAKKKTAKKKTAKKTRVDAKQASRPTRTKKTAKKTRVDAKQASRPTRTKKTAKKKTAKKKTAKKKTKKKARVDAKRASRTKKTAK